MMLPFSQFQLLGYVDEFGRRRFALWFKGLDAVASAKVTMALTRLERAPMRAAIRALPDGRYSFADVLDNDGDNKVDFVTCGVNSSKVKYYQGDGLGTFTEKPAKAEK